MDMNRCIFLTFVLKKKKNCHCTVKSFVDRAVLKVGVCAGVEPLRRLSPLSCTNMDGCTVLKGQFGRFLHQHEQHVKVKNNLARTVFWLRSTLSGWEVLTNKEATQCVVTARKVEVRQARRILSISRERDRHTKNLQEFYVSWFFFFLPWLCVWVSEWMYTLYICIY